VRLRLGLSEIWKKYPGTPVLRGCSFSFDSGVYALTGSNGCGKSTLLRICALLERPDRGEVTYFSGDAVAPSGIELMRRITLLLPTTGVFNTTVFKNAAYGLKIRGMKARDIEDRVTRVLDFVELGHKKKQNALTLSSGETQRLGLARAMAVEPEVLFLDEPTASVDERNREAIEDIILKMKKETQSTVIVTTHDIKQAEKLADKILILKDGKISAR
jgi:tungstate transport system ATP-binding protein